MKITASRKDQLGMQLYCRIYAMAYAEANNLEYFHTPFPKRYKNFENFFNLGFNSKPASDCKDSIEDIGDKIIPAFLSRDFCRYNPIKFNKTFVAKLRYKYFLEQKVNSEKFKASKGLKVAIHIRGCSKEKHKEGNDPNKSMWEIREAPESYIPACFRKLATVNADLISVHIYSNEHLHLKWDHDLYRDPKFSIYTHYKTPLKRCMHDMISADILFRYGVSAFSGVCSIYNQKLSVFGMPAYRAYLANPYISDGCCYLQPPIEFEKLQTFEEVALDNFLCNKL